MVTPATPEKKAVERIPGYTWIAMGIPWTFIAVISLLNFAIGIMLPSMQKDLGFNASQAGWLSGISWLLTAALTIPITFIVNKIGPKILLTFILFISGIALLINGASQSYSVLLVTRAVALVMVVGVTPALALLVIQWVPLTRVTTVNGINAFVQPAGQVLSTTLVPLMLFALAGWRPVFYIVGVIVLVMAVAWLIWGRERHTPEYEAAKDRGGGWKDLAGATRQPSVWLLAFGLPGTTLVWIAIFTFWPTYANKVLDYSLSEASLVLSLLPIGSMIASLVFPIICEKVGVDKPFIWAWGFVLPLSYYGMLLHSGPVVTGLASFLAGLGAFAFVPPSLSLPFKLRNITPGGVTLATGIIVCTIAVGGAAGGIVAGQIYQSTGNLYKALAICCLSPLTLGIFGLLLPERGRKVIEKEASEDAQAKAPN